MMISEYKLNNLINMAVITVRVVLFGAVGEPNYGERVGRKASRVWGWSPLWARGKAPGHGGS